MNEFKPIEKLKAINLYGLNAATYKPALQLTLFELALEKNSIITWDDLSKGFLKKYLERLSEKALPQQASSGRLTKMERIINELKNNKINEDHAIAKVGSESFNDVIHRFHTIGNNKDLAKDCFYEFHFGKKIILKEAFLDLTENHYDELVGEANDRWDQLERGFEINHTHGKWQLANDLRNIYLKDGYDRKSLKPNIKFLEAYQCNTCFYCGEELDPKKIEVDHVLPRQVIQHDEIWNLVLAHDHCNSQKSDKIVGPNFIEKLIHRNENIMGSNHPWKSKIESQLGKNKKARSSKLRKHYENTKTVKGSDYWNGNSNYDPSKDRFYRRIVTILCNK